MAPTKVHLFSLTTCMHCKTVKKMLDQHSIAHHVTEMDLLEGEQKMQIIEDLKVVNPKGIFPMLLVGEEVVLGYKKKEIRDVLVAANLIKVHFLKRIWSSLFSRQNSPSP